MKMLRIENTKGIMALWLVPESYEEAVAVAARLGPMSFSAAKKQVETDLQTIFDFAKWVVNPDDLVAISLAVNGMYAVNNVRQSLLFRNKVVIAFCMLRMIPTAFKVRQGVRQNILRYRDRLVA